MRCLSGGGCGIFSCAALKSRRPWPMFLLSLRWRLAGLFGLRSLWGAHHARRPVSAARRIGVNMSSSTSFLPNTDDALLAWSLNFKTLITASPVLFGLTMLLATAYGALHDAYASALAAADPAIRTRGAVATK